MVHILTTLNVVVIGLASLVFARKHFPGRTIAGPVPGVNYMQCVNKNHFAITFDDGPYNYTPDLLNFLELHNITTTFFVNGWNWACIYDPKYTAIIKEAHSRGHQIAAHTWSHPPLATLSNSEILNEMVRLENATRKILGVVPRYMRPPYGSGADSSRIKKIMKQLGYIMVTWNVDTLDATIDDPNPENGKPHKLSDAKLATMEHKAFFSDLHAAKNVGHIILMHDTFDRTVHQLAPWVIKQVKMLGYEIVNAAQCLGQPNPVDWYKGHTTPSKRDSTWFCPEDRGHCWPYESC